MRSLGLIRAVTSSLPYYFQALGDATCGNYDADFADRLNAAACSAPLTGDALRYYCRMLCLLGEVTKGHNFVCEAKVQAMLPFTFCMKTLRHEDTCTPVRVSMLLAIFEAWLETERLATEVVHLADEFATVLAEETERLVAAWGTGRIAPRGMSQRDLAGSDSKGGGAEPGDARAWRRAMMHERVWAFAALLPCVEIFFRPSKFPRNA